MSTVAWILISGTAMSLIAFAGAVTLVLPEQTLRRIVLPLVALSAGSLIGGAFFHMLPESVTAIGNDLSVYVWLVAGFLVFFLLEQFLHWHHCHRVDHAHCEGDNGDDDGQRQPLGYLLLTADGLHNLIGGLAVGGAFVVDIRVGIVTWLAAAAHEIPQELGDFGVLVHSGWRPRSALIWNFVSALTFLPGALAAYALADHIDVAYLLPFAAGNFIYIAAADLLPEVASQIRTRDKLETTVAFIGGLALLLVATRIG